MTYFQAEANKLQEAIDRVRSKLHYMYNHGDYETKRVVIEILDALDGEPDV